MFKERVITLVKEVGLYSTIVLVAILLTWGLVSLPFNLGTWLMLGLLALMLLVGLAGFIHWLIIEPIKFSKWYQNRKSST